MRDRLIYGTLITVSVVALFWLDHAIGEVAIGSVSISGVVIFALTLLMMPIASRELRGMAAAKSIDISAAIISIAAWLVLLLFVHPAGPDGRLLAALIWGVLTAALIWAIRKGQVTGAIASVSVTLTAVIYLGVLGGFYLLMRQEWPAWIVVAAILTVKCGDIGAYFTGRAIGKRKLIPFLSPGKTWEGLFGGIALAAIAAACFTAFANSKGVMSVNPIYAAIGGGILAIVGHAGDLTISLFKRDAQIKDSGKLIPGSGGILDILDSPLFAAPVAYGLLCLA